MSGLEIKLWFLGRPSCSLRTVLTDIADAPTHHEIKSRRTLITKHNDNYDSNNNNYRNIKKAIAELINCMRRLITQAVAKIYK
jgi:hypothetical protein